MGAGASNGARGLGAASAATRAKAVEYTAFAGDVRHAGFGAQARHSATWCGCPALSLACRLEESLACAHCSGKRLDMGSSARQEDEMKTQSKKEIAKQLVVLLLFVVFGCCVPGYAASKGTAVAGRRAS